MTLPKLGNFTLADIDEMTVQKRVHLANAMDAKVQWDGVVAAIRPLLQAHPTWTLSDAVEHLRQADDLH